MNAWRKLVYWVAGGIPHDDRRWLGHKIATIGFLLAVGGAAPFFVDGLKAFREASRFVVYIGFAMGVVGVIVSWFTINNDK
jgi:hypothetical protein